MPNHHGCRRHRAPWNYEAWEGCPPWSLRASRGGPDQADGTLDRAEPRLSACVFPLKASRGASRRARHHCHRRHLADLAAPPHRFATNPRASLAALLGGRGGASFSRRRRHHRRPLRGADRACWALKGIARGCARPHPRELVPPAPRNRARTCGSTTAAAVQTGGRVPVSRATADYPKISKGHLTGRGALSLFTRLTAGPSTCKAQTIQRLKVTQPRLRQEISPF